MGDLQPRKNHLGLLKAFEELLRAHPQLTHDLVFVGKETWYSKELHRAVERSSMRGRVHFTGFVEDADLVHFYGACDLFVFPSFYEGFGLPILEAMACGRAVACSNTTAMPEVANAAGILFDPESTGEMARAISRRAARSGIAHASGTAGDASRGLVQLGKGGGAHFGCIYESRRRQEGRRRKKAFEGRGSRPCMMNQCILMKYCICFLLLVPAHAETLHYVINWPSGLSLGEATLTFGVQTTAGKRAERQYRAVDRPIWISTPAFRALPSRTTTLRQPKAKMGRICVQQSSIRPSSAAARKSEETVTFDQDQHTVTRETHVEAAAARAMSTYPLARATRSRSSQFARKELAQGRWPRSNR